MIRSIFVIVWGLMMAAFASPTPGLADPLVLGVGDIVSVSVLNRPDISGMFQVADDGAISIHVLGRVQARGKSVADLEATIESSLSLQTDLPISVTAEAASWRPVFVLGDVERPGQITYLPGMTVQKLVAIAGGLYPRLGATTSNIDVRLADEGANLGRLREELSNTMLNRARLTAELAGQLELVLPTEVNAPPEQGAALIAEQTAILVRQANSIDASVSSAEKRAVLADAEAETLASQQKLLSDQIVEDEKAADALQKLFEQGLSNSERVRQITRSLNDDKIQLMLAATYEARARQDKILAEASIDQLISARQNEIVVELAQLAASERQTRVRIASTEAFLVQFGYGVPETNGETVLAEPFYRIIRAVPGSEDQIIEAQPTAQLFPGDVLEVKRGGWTAP